MTTSVFKISNTKEGAIYPPEQVFWKQDFLYMFTIGGHLVGSEVNYQKLMHCLKKFNEKCFFILENMGTVITDREDPFYAKISVLSNLSDFNNVVNQFDPPFGFYINDFFIYGENDNWGIYLCECPTINIIGCRENYVKDFSEVFNIKGNGFDSLKDFIGKEYENHPELLQKLISNYNLYASKNDKIFT
ncbi:MAG: hypothetical protein FWG84_02955 [Bacteroidales bacterium]|nr:hypothetical protein [Bacteroidales bacterium]